MIFDQYMAPNDVLDCSNQTLKTIELRIRDGRGRYINLHSAHISFSIVCNNYNLNEYNIYIDSIRKIIFYL